MYLRIIHVWSALRCFMLYTCCSPRARVTFFGTSLRRDKATDVIRATGRHAMFIHQTGIFVEETVRQIRVRPQWTKHTRNEKTRRSRKRQLERWKQNETQNTQHFLKSSRILINDRHHDDIVRDELGQKSYRS